MEERLIDTWSGVLFEHGLETYNPNAPKGAQQGNIGGAKLYWHGNYKDPTKSDILFNNADFAKAITQFSASLYTLNRVETNKDGEPVQLPEPQKGFRRICNGLMLYAQLDEDPKVGVNMRDRILESLKKAGLDLTNYIDVASNIKHENIQKLTQMKHRDFLQRELPMKLSAAVLIALPSGSLGSSAMWAFADKKKTRAGMSAATTEADTVDLQL